MAKYEGFDPNKTGEQALPQSFRNEGKIEHARALVEQASPFLAMTSDGTVIASKELRPKAEKIHNVLYGIAASRGATDFDERVSPHHEFINESVWIPVLGRDLLHSIRDHFQREGIHCYSSEALNRESKAFEQFVRKGDVGRFAEFLMWCLKDDPTVITKIDSRLG